MRRFLLPVTVLVVFVAAYVSWALWRPLPTLQPVSILGTLPSASEPTLSWPTYGQAAVGGVGYGLLASQGEQKPLPTASVAKVMTALAVLQKKPLKPGEQGPTLTLTDRDIGFYNDYVAQGGSVVPVNYGEQLSEYQALQAMLLPSANNIAKSLAAWAFGSEQNYTAYADSYAKQLGLQHSHFADASGFSPSTVSTASDLVSLGSAALKNSVLAQIVSQASADIPVAGTVENVNGLLGQNGINGIKTGNTDQAGGVYLVSSSRIVVSKHPVTIIAAIVGAPSLGIAMQDALPLLDSAAAGFAETRPISTGKIIGYYNTPWGTSANAVADGDLTVFGWKGTKPKLVLSLAPIRAPVNDGHLAGTLKLSEGSTVQQTNVTIQKPLPGPSWRWRLLHP